MPGSRPHWRRTIQRQHPACREPLQQGHGPMSVVGAQFNDPHVVGLALQQIFNDLYLKFRLRRVIFLRSRKVPVVVSLQDYRLLGDITGRSFLSLAISGPAV